MSLTRDVAEMRALLASAGHRIVDEIVQVRAAPDARTFVGHGKVLDVRARIERGGVDIVVFAGELRPAMHYRLERDLGIECYDRLRVLLELFAQRAATREAKLQVELALLRYEVPLLREWIHEAEIGERPGFMAGGEYRVDAYYETVKRRMKKIRDDLDAVRRERGRRRTLRKERGFGLVALAGYANAGKSSLLNALTGEHVLVEDRMFSTLSTTTRAIPDAHARVLLTDTVGFVEGVPLWMIDAFQATLEEVFEADLILLLLDASDADDPIRNKIRLASRILLPRVPADAVLPVLTKVDLIDSGALARAAAILRVSEFPRSPVIVSARTGRGLDELRDVVWSTFPYPIEMRIVLSRDAHEASKLHAVHERAQVLEVIHHADRVEILVRCRPRDRGLLESFGRVLDVREAVSP